MKHLALAALLTAAAVSPALAHAKLESEQPADKATVTPGPSQLVLTFSEALEASFSGATISAPSGAVDVKSSGLDPKDNKVLDVTLAEPLPAGTYTVSWHVVSADGHKTAGTYSFTVK